MSTSQEIPLNEGAPIARESARYRALIIEDDPVMAKALEAVFQHEGFQVFYTGSGPRSLQLAVKYEPQLILLDQMLEDADGVDVCRQLRLRGVNSVIIFLTVRAQEDDKLAGFDAGADDYITKPFSLRELTARVRAHLKRETLAAPFAQTAPLRFGDVEVDFDHYTAKHNGHPVGLTPKEFELLRLLASHPREVLSRDRILEKVWGYDSSTTTRTVDTHITRLRKKLECDPSNPRHFLTSYGEGYKFIA